MNYSNAVLVLFSIICFIEVSSKTIPISPPTLLFFFIYICLLILIYLGLNNKENIHSNFKKTLYTYWFYSLFVIFYGLILSDSYWDYKNIFTTYIPGVMISFAIFIGLNYEKNFNLFRSIITRTFPIAVILGVIFYTFFDQTRYTYGASRLASPIFFFILAFPFLKKNHQLLVLFISVFSIFIDPAWRTNVLRIFICFGFIIFYYIFSLKKFFINFICTIVLIIPLLFLYTGMSGKFDVFSYLSTDNQGITTGNTRTFLYIEVFDSLQDKNINTLMGGGANSGYRTNVFFDSTVSNLAERERYRSEVRFLNTLNQSGIIGVILDMLIIFIPAFLAINRSNNNFSKLLGLYLCLSWIIYFLEIPLSLNLIYFIHYLIIGLCLNNSFRDSNNEEIKLLFKKL